MDKEKINWDEVAEEMGLDSIEEEEEKKEINPSQIGDGILPEELKENGIELPGAEEVKEIIEEEPLKEVLEEEQKEIVENIKEKEENLTLEERKSKKLEEEVIKERKAFLEEHLNADYLSLYLGKRSEEQKDIRKKVREFLEKKEEINFENIESLLERIKPLEVEKEEEQEEEIQTPKKKQKYLHGQMRNLLRDYPMGIEFNGTNNFINLTGSVIQVYELLQYCKLKTNDDEVERLFQVEIDSIEKLVDIKNLRLRLFEFKNNGSKIRERILLNSLKEIVYEKGNELVDKVIYFSLAVPSKDKKYMNLRNAHGLSASSAEEFESEAISDGERVSPGQPFVVTEEGGIELA